MTIFEVPDAQQDEPPRCSDCEAWQEKYEDLHDLHEMLKADSQKLKDDCKEALAVAFCEKNQIIENAIDEFEEGE